MRINLRETVERLLQRRLPDLARRPAPTVTGGEPPGAARIFPQRSSARVRAARQARREQRASRFQAVQELTQKGLNIPQIADDLTPSRQTVRRYRAATVVPEVVPPRPEPSLLTPYLAWLQQQWAAGETNAAALARALAAQGSRGATGRWPAGRSSSALRMGPPKPQPADCVPQPSSNWSRH